MAVRTRLAMLTALLLVTLSIAGAAFAQTDGPDPDSPIQIPTVSADDESANGTPTDDSAPVERGATPAAHASPVAGGRGADLAAMTLDSSAILDEFVLIGEAYVPIAQLAESFLGMIEPDELLATGMTGFYQSSYVNATNGVTVRTYVSSYETIAGVQAGFDLLENEELLVPNSGFEDLPGLAGVGEGPAEVTTGFIESGDGTRSTSYDVTFRIDRYLAGAAMDVPDGSEPQAELVDEMARALATRVTNVVAGNDVNGVDYGLPATLIQFSNPPVYEGYQSASETILSDETGTLADGYLSGYYRAATFSTSSTSILPYVTIGVNSFATVEDAQEAFNAPEAMMPFFPDLGEVTDITIDGVDPLEIEGADAVIALSFSSPQGVGIVDSVRLFVRVGETLISIDVQGMDSMKAAIVAADLAQLQTACLVDGVCDVPGGL